MLALETPPGLLRGRLRSRLRDRRPLRRRRVALRRGDGIRLRLSLGADLRLGAVLLAHLRRLLGSLLGADLLGDALLLARLLLRGHALLGDVRGVRVLPPVVIRRVRVERRDGLVEVGVVAERATGGDVHATRGAVVVAARGGEAVRGGRLEERDGRGKGEVSPAVSDSSEGIVNRGSSERQKARENERCDSRAGRETHSLRMCSSMHLAQKRCRHGDTTFTFFIVPQHTAHRVSWRTGPSFIVAARRDVQWPMRSGRREDARAGATTETCTSGQRKRFASRSIGNFKGDVARSGRTIRFQMFGLSRF